MSLEHDVTYTWVYGSAQIKTTRQIVAAAMGSLDTQIPTGLSNDPQAFSLLLAKVQSIYLACDQAVTLSAGGTSAVQSVTVTGSPAGGYFTLTLSGQTTGHITYSAIASAVQSALVAISTIGAGGCVVTGGPLPGTPVSVTFAGPKANQVVALMTSTDSFSGGSAPASAVATTTPGVAPDTTIDVLAGVPLVWDAAAYAAQPFAADVVTLYVTNASGAGANLKIRTLSDA